MPVPIEGYEPGQYWDNANKQCVWGDPACVAVDVSTLNTKQRNKAIAAYGASGGTYYDQIETSQYSLKPMFQL